MNKIHLGRKVGLFIVTLAIVTVLSYFNKDTAAVVALFGTYCAGNVGSHFSNTLRRSEVNLN